MGLGQRGSTREGLEISPNVLVGEARLEKDQVKDSEPLDSAHASMWIMGAYPSGFSRGILKEFRDLPERLLGGNIL